MTVGLFVVEVDDHVANVIDPAKLTTLKERGANSHVRKAVYWLAAAELKGEKRSLAMDAAPTLRKTP